MTHDEAIKAAAKAQHDARYFPGAWDAITEVNDDDQAEATRQALAAVNAYLSAFGVRDLAGLVTAARECADELAQYNSALYPLAMRKGSEGQRLKFEREMQPVYAVDAALSPTDETR